MPVATLDIESIKARMDQINAVLEATHTACEGIESVMLAALIGAIGLIAANAGAKGDVIMNIAIDSLQLGRVELAKLLAGETPTLARKGEN